MCYDVVADNSCGEEKINSNLKKDFFNLIKLYNLVNYIKCVLNGAEYKRQAKH